MQPTTQPRPIREIRRFFPLVWKVRITAPGAGASGRIFLSFLQGGRSGATRMTRRGAERWLDRKERAWYGHAANNHWTGS